MTNRDSDKRNQTLKAALQALARGLHPIPVEENGKYALVPWEKYKTTKPSREEVIEWFSRWPKANLGIITGTFFGVMALELEYGHDPWPPPGCSLDSGCIVETPGGTLYVYYMASFKIRNTFGNLARGVNILDNGRYVLIPPSRIDGKPYCYKKGSVAEGSYRLPPYWLDKKLIAFKRKQNKKVIFDALGARIIRKGHMRQYDLDQAKISYLSNLSNLSNFQQDIWLTEEDF